MWLSSKELYHGYWSGGSSPCGPYRDCRHMGNTIADCWPYCGGACAVLSADNAQASSNIAGAVTGALIHPHQSVLPNLLAAAVLTWSHKHPAVQGSSNTVIRCMQLWRDTVQSYAAALACSVLCCMMNCAAIFISLAWCTQGRKRMQLWHYLRLQWHPAVFAACMSVVGVQAVSIVKQAEGKWGSLHAR